MLRRSKESFKTGLFSIFLLMLFIISYMGNTEQILIENNPVKDNNEDRINSFESSPIPNAADDFSPVINGTGLNRTVHISMRNSSSTSGTNYFNISGNSDNEYLYGGSFNFNFTNLNDTTLYTLEDDTPLEYPLVSQVSDRAEIYVQDGALSAGNAGDNDTIQGLDGNTPVEVDSSSNKVTLNYTVDLSNFNNTQLLGFNITLIIEIDNPLDLEIKAYNYNTSVWEDVRNTHLTLYNSKKRQTYYIINKNLNYCDLWNTKNASFSFIYTNSTTSFTVKVYGIEVRAIRGFDAPITSTNKVALEFDTKGAAKIHGFSAWIRSFNIYEDGITSNLTIRLYSSNETNIKRSSLLDVSKLMNGKTTARPDETELLAEVSILNYTGDGVVFFNLSSPVSVGIGNYFFEISTNTGDFDSGKSFSIVGIPNVGGERPDPDGYIDHLLVHNATQYWNTYYYISGTYIVDAAGFSVNLTRAYLPSEMGATLNGLEITDTYIDPAVHEHDTTGYYAQYWWGLGKVEDATFNPPIKCEYNNFVLNVSWSESLNQDTMSFEVNYTVEKYIVDSAETNYTLVEGELPNWNVTYVLNTAMDPYWNFTSLSFFIPEDWIIQEVIAKNGSDVFSQASYYHSSSYPDISDNQEIKLDNDTIIGDPTNGNGTYKISANSPNYIRSLDPKLNYKGYLWDTNGFMPGDNISVGISAADANGYYLDDTGNASYILYDPDNNQIRTGKDPVPDMNSSQTYTYYKFDKDVIYETNETVPLGTYTLAGIWTDGEELGYAVERLYINNYTGSIFSVQQNNDLENNEIRGKITTFQTDDNLYDFMIYAVKKYEPGQTYDEYMVNNTGYQQIVQDIYLTQYLQNETFFNPGEDMKLKLFIKNTNTTLSYVIKIKMELVYMFNTDWIIANATSPEKTLAIAGDPSGNDVQEIDLNITIPTIDQGGQNCPIRFGPVLIKYTVYLEGNERNTFYRNTPGYISAAPESEFEGRVLLMKLYANRTGSYYIAGFDYDHLELPDTRYYFIQAYNKYYQTMNMEANYSIYEKLTGKIENFEIAQSIINKTSTIDLTGRLLDTYDNPICTDNISIYITNGTADTANWVLIGSALKSDFSIDPSTGDFRLEIDLRPFNLQDMATIRISYAGNATILAFTRDISFELAEYLNEVEIGADIEKLIVDYRNIIRVTVVNKGNSSLANISLAVINSTFKAAPINTTALNPYEDNILLPGEKAIFTFEFNEKIYTEQWANFTFQFTADVIETGEHFNSTRDYTVKVLRINEDALINTIIVAGYIAIAALVYLFSIKYIRNKYKEINTVPVDESKEKGPSGKPGKYVKVDELKRKKDFETPSDSKASKKKGVSIDELAKKKKSSGQKGKNKQ